MLPIKVNVTYVRFSRIKETKKGFLLTDYNLIDTSGPRNRALGRSRVVSRMGHF